MPTDHFDALPDLASRALGGGVVYANDEFFAAADHLVLPAAPTFTPRTFDHKGQVYDGWETRRRRSPGADVAIIRLGAPGVIHGVDVDTAFFVGNYPAHASIDALAASGYPGPDELVAGEWTPLVPKSPLAGDTRNLFPVSSRKRFTHVRLTIHPDGGVARLRVHGEVVPDPALLPEEFDVAALTAGATVSGCSNMFFGRPHNMLMPGLAHHMGDGWETARRRETGNEWAIISLAAPTSVTFVDIDTSHFKGNAPGAVVVLASSYPAPAPSSASPTSSGTASGAAAPSPAGPSADGPSASPSTSESSAADLTRADRSAGGPSATVVPAGGPSATPTLSADGPSVGDPTAADPSAAGSSSAKSDISDEWFELLPRTPLQPDTPHRFPVAPGRPVYRVRLDIIPDGGVARLRIIGRPDRTVLEENFRRHVETP